MDNQVEATIAERAKIYGDPHDSHVNIGLAWTGLIQQHYGISLPHPLPAYVVALMMVDCKASRAVRGGSPVHDDNYVDMEAYKQFAREFEKKWKSSNKTL
jgi:hypothetical protein